MLTCNRADFSWALKAVLEHVGPAVKHLDFVGLQGFCWWATDGHTAGVANPSAPAGEPVLPGIYLPIKEARDLYRFVRSDLVRDREDVVHVIIQGEHWSEPEMHVGIRNPAGEVTSKVYDLLSDYIPPLNFDHLWNSFQDIKKRLVITDEFVMDADLQARFRTAKRQPGDRMRWWPAEPAVEGHGQRALVTVGSDFLGAIIGLGEPTDKEAIFGDSTLEDWGL